MSDEPTDPRFSEVATAIRKLSALLLLRGDRLVGVTILTANPRPDYVVDTGGGRVPVEYHCAGDLTDL